jgi:CRP/FNR family transcriptional regulator, cyclic AMP receptor protein
MRTIDELLGDIPALASLEPAHLELISGCAVNQAFEADAYLMREGEPADAFYAIRQGAVALETYIPQRGALTIETLHDGDLLGWSWLVPPYRTAFDARSVGTTHTIAFDGACLRGKLDADPALGYELMRCFVPLIVERLQATRIRLLDVYGQLAS